MAMIPHVIHHSATPPTGTQPYEARLSPISLAGSVSVTSILDAVGRRQAMAGLQLREAFKLPLYWARQYR